MAQGLTVRQMAAALRIQVPTAFRWRHRLLSVLCHQSQPALTGSMAVCEAYVRYSEKGSRRIPGIPRIRPFRRFTDGKPSALSQLDLALA